MSTRLSTYRAKRCFESTPEPSGASKPSKPSKSSTPTKRTAARAATRRAPQGLAYVIQRHDARRLHYDFRLELDGTLKSWAVPKGPSLDPAVKRLAVHVEDHPLEYGAFEGVIPEGSYGAGTVEIWDRGTWRPQGSLREAREGYAQGRLKFELDGQRLHGGWTLVRTRMDGAKEQWLLIKERDAEARSADEFDVEAEPDAERKASRKTTATTTIRSGPRAATGRERPERREHPEHPEHPEHRAPEAALPETLNPELATPADTLPSGEQWLYETKFDGYRVLVRIDRHDRKNGVRVFTRGGHDWTGRFEAQTQALARLDVQSAWLDGEAVVLDERGIPDFQALQNAFDAGRSRDVVFYLFDLPYLNGADLSALPLDERRARLRALLGDGKHDVLRFSASLDGDPQQLLEAACSVGLEGIVAKRRDSLYTSARSSAWLKLRCALRQEFVIGGYTDPAGSRSGFGALLLGVYDDAGGLRYAGRVGTGFGERQLASIAGELKASGQKDAPFVTQPPTGWRARVHWVRPELVAECRFKAWTDDGIVRQASFVGLRRDKPAREIVREPQGLSAAGTAHAQKPRSAHGTNRGRTQQAAPDDVVAGVRISHPDRTIDTQTGTRKIDLVRYFEWVAPWILRDLHERPVALVRAPDGVGHELFFQKHATRMEMPNVTQHPGLDPGHAALLTIESVGALVGAAQMGTIELHAWNARVSAIEKPDRVVFDLDPDPSLGWDRMIDAATLARTLLDELGLACWCKTSGGKGLHVVVPIVRRAGWDEAKAFAHAVADHMAKTLPDRFTSTMGPRNRKGKIFIDYLRNNRGASTIAAYAPRARPGLGVSVPIAWEELERTTGGAQWTIANLHERLDALHADPWAGFAHANQRITAALFKRLS